MWMLHNHLGREQMLAGLQQFIRIYREPPDQDYPALQDFIATLRPFAPDSTAFDSFVQQWFYEVVIPEYHMTNATLEQVDDGWKVSALLENTGTGIATVELAAARGERFVGSGYEQAPTYTDDRVMLTLAPNKPQQISWIVGFKPDQLVIDPDALVLQRNREQAVEAILFK